MKLVLEVQSDTPAPEAGSRLLFVRFEVSYHGFEKVEDVAEIVLSRDGTHVIGNKVEAIDTIMLPAVRRMVISGIKTFVPDYLAQVDG